MVGGWPAAVVPGAAVDPGGPGAPVVTVGTRSPPPLVNAGPIKASTITTATPISRIPTGCQYHGGGAPGGRGGLGDGGGR